MRGNQKRVTSGIFAQTREELLNLNLHRCGTFLRQGTSTFTTSFSSVSLFFFVVVVVAIFLGFIRRRFNDEHLNRSFVEHEDV